MDRKQEQLIRIEISMAANGTKREECNARAQNDTDLRQSNLGANYTRYLLDSLMGTERQQFPEFITKQVLTWTMNEVNNNAAVAVVRRQ